MAGVTLSFDGQGLRLDTEKDAEEICKQLADVEVRSLILQGNTFGIEAAKRIGEELTKQKFLREAHFKDIFTSRSKSEVPVAIDHLLSGISRSGTELTLLDLSDNAIGPVGAPAVEKFLRTRAASKIERLYINNCGMGPEGGSSIAHAISLLHLKEFVCGRNRLEDKGAKFMFSAISEMRTLEELRMPQNGITPEGIKVIVMALMKNISKLRVIDFSDNTIKVEGSEALEEVITKARSLTELKLDDALLGNEGFSIICDAISRSNAIKTLKSASFEGNEIKGLDIVDLIEITFKDTQVELNLLDNEFKRVELERLQTMLDKINLIVDDPEDEDYDDEDDDDDDDTEGENDENGCSAEQNSALINSLHELEIQ